MFYLKKEGLIEKLEKIMCLNEKGNLLVINKYIVYY